jgi:hypothetical protein
MQRVFVKIFVWGFYKANAGLFTFLLLFLFGMIRMNEHILIARFFLESYGLLVYPLFVWIIYNLNVFYHFHSLARIPQNYFLSDSILADRKILFRYAVVVQVLIFFPLILYGLLLAALAIEEFLWVKSFIILGSVFILLGLNSWYFMHQVCRQYNAFPEEKVYLRKPGKRTLRLEQQYFHYIFLSDPVRLMISKIISLVIILAVFYLYRNEEYKFSLITIGILSAALMNGMIIYDMHDFFENKYSILRNLPVPLLQKAMKDLYIILILVLPEIAAIIRNSVSGNFTLTIEITFFMLSLLFLVKAILLIRPVDTETFLKWIVYGFIILTFVLLYQPPLIVLIVFFYLLAGLLYTYLYYRYDPVIHTPDTN